MSEVVLYDYWCSSAAYRVRIALNLKGVAYRRVPIDLSQGVQLGADYMALNPQGLVPALAIDGLLLTQSLAIIDYLDANFPEPPMVSSDPASRSRTLAQALIIAADIHPINNLRVLNYLRRELGQGEDAVNNWYRHWIAEGLAALEAQAPPAWPVRRSAAQSGGCLSGAAAGQRAAVRSAARALSQTGGDRRGAARIARLCRCCTRSR